MFKKCFLPLTLIILSNYVSFSQVTPIIQYRQTYQAEKVISDKSNEYAKSVYARAKSNLKKSDSLTSPSHVDLLKKAIDLDSSNTARETMDNFIPTSQNSRDSLFWQLNDSLKIARNDDSLGMVRINKKIGAIQIYNTNEFLSPSKKPILPFTIHRIRYLDIDSLNKYLYNQSFISALQTASVNNFTNSNTVITVEFASALFGPVRMGLSGSFSSKKDSTENNAIQSSLQKIVSNGGEFNINFLVPLIYCRNRKDQVHFGIFAQSNSGVNPGINDSTGNTDFSNNILFTNQSGFLFHADFGSNDVKTRISVDLPYYYVWGSKQTYNQLGVSDYSLLKLRVGLIIGDLINLNISGPLLCTSKTVQKVPFSLSVQFSPAQVVKSSSGKN